MSEGDCLRGTRSTEALELGRGVSERPSVESGWTSGMGGRRFNNGNAGDNHRNAHPYGSLEALCR